ncbi:hypothetical protein PBT90_14910 [Algoriphagus halophytocola]|uniref:Collagen-like protein n=1 Tax=Algoriphagus halophytocola TaxID=2991499 RepID=A0ABY6MNE4_9BACT|nr:MULTISPECIES: hypothetical protein [unclassified Algoriphagus]UZD24670.1 hypothetical protein OM944_09245 [Algoriphagus sp. TR-M5]WBL42038.1 hypothetical protein PBT90_14910 [Algoriphagus sp. TR-M9]
MRKITAVLALVGLFTFQACEGPMGPEGPQGIPGEDGVNILGTTYEVEIDFTPENNHSDLFQFPAANVESDVILVYRLAGVDDGRDIWTMLPQNFFFQEGVLIYNFDFTLDDFSIFMDGPIDYELLGPDWTDGQIFRVVVVPSDFPAARIDFSDYEATMKMLDIEDADFLRLDSSK